MNFDFGGKVVGKLNIPVIPPEMVRGMQELNRLFSSSDMVRMQEESIRTAQALSQLFPKKVAVPEKFERWEWERERGKKPFPREINCQNEINDNYAIALRRLLESHPYYRPTRQEIVDYVRRYPGLEKHRMRIRTFINMGLGSLGKGSRSRRSRRGFFFLR